MALEVNAQYVRFVQFAQQQDDAVNSKAIARVSGEDGALDGRAITAATNDKVAPWTRRSQVKKDANNIARELFRQSIIDMFGGADWKNYDREAIRKIENDLARPHRLEEAANALPEDTRLDVDVDVSFGINVDNFVM